MGKIERIEISSEDREELRRLVRDRNTPQKVVWRARIVLLAGNGMGALDVAAEVGMSILTVRRWRRRYRDKGVAGLLKDATRPARNKTFEQRLGERWKVHPLTEAIYRTGCYGRKTGSGYMDYSGPTPVPNPKVVDTVRGYLNAQGVTKKASAQEIIDLMLAAAINEAAFMIEEGICDRPQDMDLAMIYGTGFPPYRGGILRYADQWGLQNVQRKLAELERQYETRSKPAGLIQEMAGAGKTFYKA